MARPSPVAGPCRVDGRRLDGRHRGGRQRLAHGPTAGLALAKQAILAATENSLENQLTLEAKLQSKAGATADYREGVTAFLEKRPAKFTGK